ncbi:MAG TPA: PKD domain-containing protein [Nitrososphaeraceae archaeon]|nr:PKD domain-containing protein [Nitrososphaeraceae archaeon]
MLNNGRVLMAVFILSALSLSMNISSVQGQMERQQQQQSPPVADAGPDQEVKEGDQVRLTGTKSFDSNGEIVSFTWGVEDSDDESPALVLEGQNTPIATFTAPQVGGNVDSNSYLFELTVTDNEGLTGSNTSKVVVVKR